MEEEADWWETVRLAELRDSFDCGGDLEGFFLGVLGGKGR